MNIITIRCDHTSARLQLEIADADVHYIQCQLVQIKLTPAQTRQVCALCPCMAPGMWFDQDGKGGAAMTIDPSQLRLDKDHSASPVG